MLLDDLIKFYFNFHNHINKKLNKPQYNEAKLYSDYTSYDIKICIENINMKDIQHIGG